MQGNVFISYRRGDTAGYAGRLYDRLKASFPGRVFIDVGEIPPGADFVTTIEKHIAGCSTLIALIGSSWTAQNRLHDSDDLVRIEIASALQRNISVIPVLVGAASLPASSALPEDIRPLLRRQTISLSDEDWDHGCERLIQALRTAVGSEHSGSRAAVKWGFALAAVAVLVVGGILFLKGRRPQQAARSVPPAPASMPETSRAAGEYDKSVANSYNAAAQVMNGLANKIGESDKPEGPTITSVSPQVVFPGDKLTISGVNFEQRNKSVLSVSYKANHAVHVVVPHVIAWNANSITILIDDTYPPGDYELTVRNKRGSSAAAEFTVKAH